MFYSPLQKNLEELDAKAIGLGRYLRGLPADLGYYRLMAERHGVRLYITVWPYDGDIRFDVHHVELDDALTSFALHTRSGGELVENDDGVCFVFEDCLVSPRHLWWVIAAGDGCKGGHLPYGMRVRVAVYPEIEVSLERWLNPGTQGEAGGLSKLRWDLVNFIECLEVLPQDERGPEYLFEVVKGDVQLNVCVAPDERMVYLDLYRAGAGSPVVGLAFCVRGEAEFKKYRNGQEFIVLTDCLVAPRHPSPEDGGVALHDTEWFPWGMDVRLTVNPEIEVRLS